ncbi:MAG: hypothetical protein QF649_05820, partial [SAR324 cluster bacterium]|nr:hypothetical protein [SAR324 cluster bacterium]
CTHMHMWTRHASKDYLGRPPGKYPKIFMTFCKDFLLSNFTRPQLKTTKGSHSFWRSIWLKH